MKVKLKKILTEICLMGVTVAAAITLGTHTPGWYEMWKGNTRSGDFSRHVAGHTARLTLYGTNTCPACIKARAYLRQAGVPFNDRVLETSESAKKDYAELGFSSVPLLVSVDTLVIGFDRIQYSSLAAATSPTPPNRSVTK